MEDILGRGWASWELSAVYRCCGTASGTSHLEMSCALSRSLKKSMRLSLFNDTPFPVEFRDLRPPLQMWIHLKEA